MPGAIYRSEMGLGPGPINTRWGGWNGAWTVMGVSFQLALLRAGG